MLLALATAIEAHATQSHPPQTEKLPQTCHPAPRSASPGHSFPSFVFKSSMGLGVETAQISFLGFYKDYSDIVDDIFGFAGPKLTIRQGVELPGYAFFDVSGSLCSGGSEATYTGFSTDALRLRTLKWSVNMRLGADLTCGQIHFRPFSFFHWDRVVSNGIATKTPLFKDYAFLRMDYDRFGLGFETSYQLKKSELLFGLSYSFPQATFKMSDPSSNSPNVTISALKTKVSASRLGIDVYVSGGFAVTKMISIIARADYTTLFARGAGLHSFSFGEYRSTYARMNTASATLNVKATY